MKHSFHAAVPVRRAFTMVELLVVVAILLILGALAFNLSRSAFRAADSTKCVNGLRQAGLIITSSASDHNNRIQAFQGGQGSFEFRPYFIARDQLGLTDNSKAAVSESLKEIFFCPSAPEPKLNHWNCYAVNFNDSELAGAEWIKEKVRDSQGRKGTVSSLPLGSVDEPANFILISDCCRSDGQQVFRLNGGGDLIGLRHNGKANAVFLDGSARSLAENDLGQLGFKNAYDTSTQPPTKVSLPQLR
jgi:prepilin-type N-terminal cleavage/methylation domain-containing protein/prepilin-type processing-associated H-X9-DG protein